MCLEYSKICILLEFECVKLSLGILILYASNDPSSVTPRIYGKFDKVNSY